MPASTLTPSDMKTIRQSLAEAQNDWTTRVAPCLIALTGTSLAGMRASSALCMARATRGKESNAWYRAYEMLLAMEQDALEASMSGQRAVAALEHGNLTLARILANHAASLEKHWHANAGWQEFASIVSRITQSEI